MTTIRVLYAFPAKFVCFLILILSVLKNFQKKKQCHFHQSCDICFESTFFFSLITKKERIFLFCFRTMNSEKQQRKSCFLVKNRSKKNQLELIDNQNDWKNFLRKYIHFGNVSINEMQNKKPKKK